MIKSRAKDTKFKIAQLIDILKSQNTKDCNIIDYNLADAQIDYLVNLLGEVLVDLEQNKITVRQAKEKEQSVYAVILESLRKKFR